MNALSTYDYDTGSNGYDVVSLPTAAKIAGVSGDTIRRWIACGDLPARRAGFHKNSRIIIDRADLDRVLKPIPTVVASQVRDDALAVTLAKIEARLSALESDGGLL